MLRWQTGRFYKALRGVASLWVGAMLLVLLLLAMACATVYESTHGTEQALHVFYGAVWFHGLLVLLGLNVIAAVIVRYPFTRRQVGFILTHLGIVVILVGAAVTKFIGVEGQLGLAEGESASHFAVGEDTLTVANRAESTKVSSDLDDSVFRGFTARDVNHVPSLVLGGARFTIDRFLPDSTLANQVTNDAPHAHPAVQISLSKPGASNGTWVFEGQSVRLGPTSAAFRTFTDEAELQRLVTVEAPNAKRSLGTVAVVHQDVAHEFEIEQCQDSAVPVEGTDLSVRVLRYLPHATVGADNKITNVSPQPVNPAIEVEITRAGTAERRVAFARFPNFQSMHAKNGDLGDVSIIFKPVKSLAPMAPLEVLAGPNGDLFVRFAWEGTNLITHELTPGSPVESPWPGMQFMLHRYFDRARSTQTMTAVDPVRAQRVSAIRVSASAGGETRQVWIQRRRSESITLGDATYDLVYSDKILPLGFTVALDRFRVGYYPGGRRPRSFESRIVLTDPETGREQTRMISMNSPTKFGGYNFYQSSYSLEGPAPVSYLSVARDPGLPIVFAGYIATMAGMVVVLVTRTRDRLRTESGTLGAGVNGKGAHPGAKDIPIVIPGANCTSGTVDSLSESEGTFKQSQCGATR